MAHLCVHAPRDWRTGRKVSPVAVREGEQGAHARAQPNEPLIEPLHCNGKQREHLGGVTAASVMEAFCNKSSAV